MSTGKGIVQGRFGRAALLEIDRPVAAHAHPHCHVLIKVLGADSTFRVRDRDYPLSDDTAVVINSWEPHAYPHGSDTPQSVILALYVQTDWLSTIEPGFAVSSSPEFFARPCFELPTGMRSRANDLSEVLTSGEQTDDDVEALIIGLMTQVIDRFSQWRALRGGRTACGSTLRDFRVRRAIRFMRDNLGQSFTVEELSRQAGLSRAHLFEVFKQNTNLTPNMFYNTLRMEAAYNALPTREQSLRSISDNLGFSAQSNFTRFFRNNLGISPKEYRRAMHLI